LLPETELRSAASSFKLHANTVTFSCNDYYIKPKAARSLAIADLQLALEENKREGRDMEKASEVWDARVA
jgi:hypothetical protein